MEFMGFDINTATTPKPWGPREEQMVKDLIQTVVGDTLGYSRRVEGHLHNSLYSTEDSPAIRAISSETGNILDIGCYGYNHQITMHAPVENDHAIQMSVSIPSGSDDVIFDVNSKEGLSYTKIKSPFSEYGVTLSEDGDIYTKGPKIDYSNEATVAGWATFSSKSIIYQTIGSMVCLKIFIDGESDSDSTSITVPFVPFFNSANTMGYESLGHISCQSDTNLGIADCFWDGSKIVFTFGPLTYTSTWVPTGRKTLSGVINFLLDNPVF